MTGEAPHRDGAAHRQREGEDDRGSARVTHLVFPKANERDWNELPDNLREGLTSHFAGHYSDVYEVAFPADAK